MKGLARFSVLMVGFALLSASAAFAAAPFHIGVVTDTVSQQEETLRAAEHMIELYGDSAEGGYITHVTYPDNFMQEMETTISQIVGLADDPLTRAIIVSNAIPGTTEAFRRVKEKDPDILCFLPASPRKTRTSSNRWPISP